MEILKVRPYQLLCLICSFGENDSGPTDDKLKKLLAQIRESPARPIMLNCNAGDAFSYQDPGVEDDTIRGSEFDRQRDLEILHKLDLMPGAILPAKAILFRLFDKIKTVSNLCGYAETISNEWIGCTKAQKGFYEKALQNIVVGNRYCERDFYQLLKEGKRSIINEKKEEDLDEEKKHSLAAMLKADEIRVRPHILVCAVEQYADGIRPPYETDNLPEMMQLIIKNPDIKIKLVEGADWMMCAPCPSRDPVFNACILAEGHGGLDNQLRDLRLLRKLGLKFGQSMKARDLFRLIFERIRTTNEICTFEGIFPSVWEDRCAVKELNWTKEGKENETYKKGKEMLMEALGIGQPGKDHLSHTVR